MPVKTRSYMNIQDLKVMKPTKRHRPAIWECMLGTVYAMNDAGEIQYFDYKWEEAKQFAGIDTSRDLRVYKNTESRSSWDRHELPRRGGTVLWILKAE
jgi:hypothetical protein